jgi:ATP phosphoribosyltransferase
MVPSLEIDAYGKALKEWWVNMQPSWRNQGGQLMCDIPPEDETWQTLKKGGTSGIYVVIMGLSWLIEAEESEHLKHDTDAWTLVEDISWVIQQMKKGMVVKEAPRKRAHEGDAEILPRRT